MTLTKITEQVLYAIAQTSSNSVSVGSPVDVSAYRLLDVRIRMGRGTGTGFTTPPIARLEGSYKTSPTANDWVTLAAMQAAAGASIGSQAVSGTEAAGQTVVTLAAGTNFAAGDYVFFHNGTIGNSEWARVLSVSGADLTLEEGLVNAQTGATCRDQAEQYHLLIEALGLQQIRLVIDNNSGGQAVVYEAGFGAVSDL
jgi:hypothetical protein